MSSPRGPAASTSTLFSVLDEDIRSGKVTRETLVTVTRKKIQEGQTNRVFDNVPRLVDDMTLARIGFDYLFIVQNARFCGAEDLDPNIATTVQMEAWTKELIKLGMSELFDERGNIRRSLVELFGWGDIYSRLDKKKLVSAYVGAVMAQVMHYHQEYINQDLTMSNGRVCSFINGHYPQWIDTIISANSSYPLGKAAAVASAGLLFGVIGAALTVGFFALTANAASTDSPKDYMDPAIPKLN